MGDVGGPGSREGEFDTRHLRMCCSRVSPCDAMPVCRRTSISHPGDPVSAMRGFLIAMFQPGTPQGLSKLAAGAPLRSIEG